MSDSGQNPFLALFGPPVSVQQLENDAQQTRFNDMIEDVFRFTLRIRDSGKNHKLFHLTDLASSLKPRTLFDFPSFERALFDYCLSLDGTVLSYLYACFERSHRETHSKNPDVEKVRRTIYSNFQLAVSQPELFQDHDVAGQLIDLLSEQADSKFIHIYLSSVIQYCQEGDDLPDPAELFSPLLAEIQKRLQQQRPLLFNSSLFKVLEVLSMNLFTGKLIVDSSILPPNKLGRDCEKTLLGSLLSNSCIPQIPAGPFDYFNEPSRSPLHEHEGTEKYCWLGLELLATSVHKIVYNLLKLSPEVNGLTRQWFGQILAMNKARGQTWAQHHSGLLKANCVSDGFMLNLEYVLLKFCQPFTSDDPKALEKLSKIDPTFCATPADRIGRTQGIHIDELYKETCLVASEEDQERPCNAPFTFLTELFYLTHRAMELGSKVVHSQMVQMSQDLNRMQRAHQDAQNQQREVAEEIQKTMDRLMTIYLSCKAAMLVPEMIQLRIQFTMATSRWLCAVALQIKPTDTLSLHFPLPRQRNPILACIPEFCISNLMDFVIFLSRFAAASLEKAEDQLKHYLTLIIVFMGSPQRLRNPHLRAAMAEMLDALVPRETQNQLGSFNLGTFHRHNLFLKHPHSKEVVATLLHVFASIEMTGQGVAFEQKFNYRRPMYAVMKFLWSLKSHRDQFKVLAVEAEANMEAAHPPLFLQFCNLLINDAIYLLDEGLSYMSKLREQQKERSDDGTWPDVPAAQRSQREATYQHMGLLARFHNMMGRETICVLELLTTEITSVFVHPTMVDRIAAMLNYFLLHLVGPKKRDFKVKDFREKYEFDPAELVSSICQTYCHLSVADAFCSAVSQDGRSYSPQLFTLAEDVLSRIGRGALIGDLQAVAQRVNASATSRASDEDLIAQAPEEFLDPIMSTIMLNPVTLPSSRVVVDRSTIARHLLSDQTDPFNRSPLTMEEVEPAEDLQRRIHQWLEETKKSQSN